MKKKLFAVLVAGLMSIGAWGSHHNLEEKEKSEKPVASEISAEFWGRTGLTVDAGDFDPFLEIRAHLEGSDIELGFQSITLGTYYRLHKNVKIGAFYRLQAGARHDDDWISLYPKSGWIWEDSVERLEHVLIADISPRFLLDFLPGESWIFSLKNRYLFNTFNSHHSVTTRPGITYFLMKDREPLLNFSFQYELYFALNFGDSPLYRHYPYLNVLYHVTPNIKLELSGAYKTVNWSASSDYLDLDSDGYSVAHRSWVIRIGALFMLEL